MSSGGLKIVSEANLGRLYTSNNRRQGEEKYKEVLVCVDHSLTPTTSATAVRQDDSNSMEHILSDSTNIFRGGSSQQQQQQEQRTFYNMDSKSWQGGFATVVSPPAEEERRAQSPIFVAAETTPSPPAVAVGGRSRGGGRRPTIKVLIKGFSVLILSLSQCSGSASGTGSVCFWASWIRIRILLVRIRILP